MTEVNQWNELKAQAQRNHVAPPARPKPTAAKAPSKAFNFHSTTLDSWDAVANRFIYINKDAIRYSKERDMWLLWDKHVWKWDQTSAVRELVKDYGRDLVGSADKSEQAWGRQVLSTKGISEVLNLTKSDLLIAVLVEEFDAEVFELNTPAGVVDLWTGKLSKATPDQLVKRSTKVAPDRTCKTPLYDRLLSQAFAGEPELSEYFEFMMGVTLIKAQHEQVFMYMFGEAGSGKGTLMNIAQKVLGRDESGYTTYVDSSILTKSGAHQHPTEMMQFLGSRMAITSEISDGQKLDTAKLKKITGGDTIKGRYMGKDFVSFDATHTLWLMANYRLQVPKDDKGVWRRLKTIEFNNGVQSGEMIKDLDGHIAEQEGPGVLARWIAKATEYLNHGFSIPQAVLTANESYQEEQDTVSLWLEFATSDHEPSSFVAFGNLRENYMDFCKQERRIAISIKALGAALTERGFNPHKKYVDLSEGRKQVRGYLGIALA